MDETYKNFEVEDFLDHPEFLSYVKGDLDEVASLRWKNWLENTNKEGENARKAVVLLNGIRSQKATIDTKALWDRIAHDVQPLDQRTTNRKKVARIIPVLRWIAASAAVILAIWWVNDFFGSETYEANPGQILVQTLPDGTEVQLNAGSVLEFRSNQWNEKRTVFLKGEAFFSVTKGIPFIVETSNGAVTVLGTEFNVFSRDERLDVEVVSGLVSVVPAGVNQKEHMLPKGASIYVEKGVVADDKMEERTLWVNSSLHYSESTLAPIFEDIERRFGLEISTSAIIDTSLFTGVVPMEDMNVSLQSVCWPLNLSFEINGNSVIIKP